MKQKSTPGLNTKMLRFGLVATMALLAIQFAVGMYLNFYVELPESHPGVAGSYAPSIPWALAGHAGAALAIHVTVWILLTLAAIALLIRGILSKRKAYIWGNAIGLLCILMAGSGGLTFVNRGGDDKESFMMALGFILAFIVYGVTFYKTKENHK